jgi:hypothetical protein
MTNALNAGAPAGGAATTARRLFWGGAALSFLISLGLYVRTMEASASFWDAGEFIAAAHILGVPHSPGTPLYVLLSKVFSLFPLWFFNVAQRINLLSAFCGAAGILFVYLLIVRFLDFTLGKSETVNDTLIKVAGALTGALFLTFSDSYWNNSIEAEVYSMSNALMGFMAWLVLKWGDDPRSPRAANLIYLLFYLLALSVGFHLGTILVLSGIFFFVLMTKEKTFTATEFIAVCLGVGIVLADATIYRDGRVTVFLLVVFSVALLWLHSARSPFATICTLLFVLGLSVHFYLLIRSMHDPVIDEGDPETWRSLYAVIRREQYPPPNVLRRKADFLFQLQHFNGYFQAQFQMASAYVSQLNLGSLLPIGLGVWGMVDQFARHKKTFVMLFVTLIVVSLGLVLYLNFSSAEVRERDYFYSPAFYFFAIYIGMGAGSLLGELRSLFARSSRRVSPVLAGCAVVLLVLPFFTLSHHYFTHDRSRNLTCPTYARNMLVGLERDSILFTNGDNDTFPLWYIQEVEEYRRDVRVVNLSLLNTPWYIEQCRDYEPKVPIAWTDEQIARLQPVPTRDGWVLVRDLAVQHILQTNKFRRPVYFAVTIPPATYAPYREYLEMEGLAYKVVPRKGDNMINVTRLERNIVELFDYKSILTADWKRDGSLHQPQHTVHLMQNYAAAFIQLAYIMHQDSTFDKSLRYLEAACEISPNMQPCQLLGLYRYDAGDTVGGLDFYRDQIEADPGNLMAMYRLSGIFERMGDYQSATKLLDAVLTADPDNRELVLTASSVAARGGMVGNARRYLTSWLARHPEDDSARQMLEELDAAIGDATGRR